MTAEISLPTISYCNPSCNFPKVFCRMRAMKRISLSTRGVSNKKSACWLLRMVRCCPHRMQGLLKLQKKNAVLSEEKEREMRTVKSFSTFILSLCLIHLVTIMSYLTPTSGDLTVILLRNIFLLKSFYFLFLVFILFYFMYNEYNMVFLYVPTQANH